MLTKVASPLLLTVILGLSACGGGGAHDDLAECLDATQARAATAESVLEGAVGAVDMLDPSAVIHVFEDEAAAKSAFDPEEQVPPQTLVGKYLVYDDDPEVLKLVRGCIAG